MLTQGAGRYAESCADFHGTPGQEPAEWSRGMRPEPPQLTEAASEWKPAEINWIITNGIEMSGMPAFGEHHAPDIITAIAAFVAALPGLSADHYETQSGSAQDHRTPSPDPAGGAAGDPRNN